MTGSRGLGLTGAPNARDLGGLPAADGQRIRARVLIRSGALGRLTDEDLPRLAALAPTTVVDLRGEPEVAEAPPNRLPQPAPRVHQLPVFDAAHSVFTYVSALLQGADLSSHQELARQGSTAAMAAIYRWFVTGAAARRSFATACATLADPANLPGVFHCSVGKDRTGWLTVILLTALGVDQEAIRADYLQTNEATAKAQDHLLTLLADRRPHADIDAIRPVLQARAAYLDAAYAEVQRVYGSFQAYLRDGLGLTPVTIAALRTNLLSP